MNVNEQDPFSEETPQETHHSSSNGNGFSSVDDFLSGGTPSAKFDKIGVVHQGVITAFEVQQQRDIKDGKPKFWPDGKPCEVMVITIATNERSADIDDDNGDRRLYVNRPGGMYSALTTAIKASKAKFAIGGTVAFKYTANGTPPQKGYNPPKEYAAHYRPPGAPAPTNPPGRPSAPTETQAARTAAYEAFKTKHAGVDPGMLTDDWRAHLKHIIPDKISTAYTTADWQKIEQSLKPQLQHAGAGSRPARQDVEAPFGEEQQFSPEEIPFIWEGRSTRPL